MYDNYDNKGIDQLSNCIDLIRNNPTSRRIIMTAWNPLALKEMCLPPCHVQYQFYVDVNTNELSCHMYQRSADVFLGLPFNIASTALLTYIVAHITGKKVGDIVISLGDAHIYSNHVDQCKEQLKRKIGKLPELKIDPNIKTLDDVMDLLDADTDAILSKFKLDNYNPKPFIPFKVAV